jgi:hypothetical protein
MSLHNLELFDETFILTNFVWYDLKKGTTIVLLYRKFQSLLAHQHDGSRRLNRYL